jgi:hypothetical protein
VALKGQGGFWPERYQTAEVVGDAVLICEPWDEIRVVDASDPSRLRIASRLGFRANACTVNALTAERQTALVASRTNCGVIELDVSDPDAVTELSRAGLETCLHWPAAYSDGRLYATTNETIKWEFAALDVADPGRPRALWSASVDNNVRSLVVADEIAYVATWFQLHTYRLTSAGEPREVGRLGGGRETRIAGVGRFVYLIQSDSGLQIVDPGL